MDIEDLVLKVLRKPIEGIGYNIIRIKKDGKGPKKLQIMAERITDLRLDINDCVKISRFASVLLENDERVSFDFTLEVSSPGIDRPLIKIDDYKKFIGSFVEIKLNTPIGNKNKFLGKICSVQENEKIEILSNEEKFLISFNFISECKLIPNQII